MRDEVLIAFSPKNVQYWASNRSAYNDPLQRALEDIIEFVKIGSFREKEFQDDLMDGYLIISEYAPTPDVFIFKLSDLGIEYIKLKLL